MNKNLIPWNPLLVVVGALTAYWNSLLEAATTRRMEQEATVQCARVGCPYGQEMTSTQVAELLEHSAAARAFLRWNTQLTNWSDFPAVRIIEIGALRAFEDNFHAMERGLLFRVKVSWEAWTSPDTSWRDEFSLLLQGDQVLYLAVFCYDTTTEEGRNILIGTIAERLQERMLVRQAQSRQQFL